jgi:hypothetical protein
MRAEYDAKALEIARQIELMWGSDRTQFVAKIQVAVLEAMAFAAETVYALTGNDGKPLSRSTRQRSVHEWCVAAFGDNHAHSIEQRGIRLVEEAIETGQACNCDKDMVHRLVDYVYARPAGAMFQEIGGVGVTLLALSEAAMIDADQAEAAEFNRVLSKPLEHFAARNDAKNAAGFNVL